eukprot:CAMPEP_0173147086 /NCGR_PEP_ID=MMETSP1105-20130129/8897_1 /TAXON_ID=2985 /ORGANISM="Ochromonas sp., Strain BG-1" /LENGTH=449 /DNA_ID=CAMNT_0014061447 /DNA_START=361 /DNA_END=1710 /DNA_ORIENTATION=+
MYFICFYFITQIRISISTICYFRDIFPNECFKTKQYGPIEIHQLQGAKKDEKTGEVTILHNDAFLVSQWLERGVFAALDLEYVSSLLFAIYTKDPRNNADVLLETYEFKITYPSPDQFPQVNDVDLASKDAVKTQAAKLVRSLTEFSSTLDTLPEERWLTIELKYTERTPAEYQPEFFCASEHGLTINRTFPLIVNIGHVKSSGLEMKLKYAGLESLLMEDIIKEIPLPGPAPSILRGLVHDPIASAMKHEVETSNSLPMQTEATAPVAETKMVEMEIEQKLDGLNLSQNSNDSAIEEGISRRTVEEIRVFISRNVKATIRKLETELFLDRKLLDKAVSYMVKKKILTKSGTSYYLDHKSQSKKDKTVEKEKSEPPKIASHPAMTVAPKLQPPQQPVHLSVPAVDPPAPVPPMILSQDSMIASGPSKIRKFGVIRDPLQVFQDHKRRRT